ncbi:MAG TPA: hypothetical protein VMU22_07700, partial [Rhizomicrobium sp.]|nr:hypothetical protein [Rhizomicrobium sp.]
DFDTHNQNFTLDNTVALSISGHLDVGGSEVDLELGTNTVDEEGGTGIISAGYLTGNSGQATLDGANAVATLGNYNTTGGAFTLDNTVALTINGTLNATGNTVTLNVSGADNGIDASAGAILANELTGSTQGQALFTDGANAVNTLGSFSNNSGQFSLTDSAALTVTGTLDATGQVLTVTDTGGGVDASAAIVKAQVLQGSTDGDAVFTNASNQIEAVGFFTNTSGAFSLIDNTLLSLGATLNAAGQTVTLIDLNGGIDSSVGQIIAANLTGSTTGNAVFTDKSNEIGTLGNFTNMSGSFSLADSDALTIAGTLNAAGQTVTLDVEASAPVGGGEGEGEGEGEGTGGPSAAPVAIDASQGTIIAKTLTGSTNGAALFTDGGNQIGTLAGFTNTKGAFSLTDSIALTVTGTLNATGQTVALVDTGGGIDASDGQIIASTLTGSANGDALFSDGENQIGTFANFTDDAGALSLTDSIALTLTGTIDPTVVTLVDTGGGIDASGAAIIADTLTGSTAGNADFTNAGNQIGTLGDFTNTSGSFSLTDSEALTVNGTLAAAHQTVTLVDTGGGIDASHGVTQAGTLTGSATGAALFTDASNAIDTLNGFETNGNVFSLTDASALTITGTLDANGKTVTLVDSGAGIDASHGVVNAATLTGSTAGDATFTANNTIGTLDAFQAGGNFSLTDAQALQISGADVSGLGFTGVAAGKSGNLAINVTGGGNGITLASNLTAGDTATLASAAGDILLNTGAVKATTVQITAAGNVTDTNVTVDGSMLASLTATAGNLVINGGSVSATTVDLTAGQNILIGEQAFTAIVLNDAPGSINQVKDPILPITVGAGGSYYEASAAYQNYVFVTAETLNLTAPQRIVSENTGTLPQSAGGYKPNGIVINQQTTPLPNAISIDGGAGTLTRPQVVDLFGTLTQGVATIGAQDIADSAQIVFGPDTTKNNAYEINGCVIHNLNSCTIVSFTIKPMDPNKQADLVLIPGGDQDEDELDLTISGEGNDEIWEDEQ